MDADVLELFEKHSCGGSLKVFDECGGYLFADAVEGGEFLSSEGEAGMEELEWGYCFQWMLFFGDVLNDQWGEENCCFPADANDAEGEEEICHGEGFSRLDGVVGVVGFFFCEGVELFEIFDGEFVKIGLVLYQALFK